jgi:hypothetical protein
VHIEPHTRTLGKHRGLPQLSDRPSRRPLLGDPRTCVIEVTSYRLVNGAPAWAQTEDRLKRLPGSQGAAVAGSVSGRRAVAAR